MEKLYKSKENKLQQVNSGTKKENKNKAKEKLSLEKHVKGIVPNEIVQKTTTNKKRENLHENMKSTNKMNIKAYKNNRKHLSKLKNAKSHMKETEKCQSFTKSLINLPTHVKSNACSEMLQDLCTKEGWVNVTGQQLQLSSCSLKDIKNLLDSTSGRLTGIVHLEHESIADVANLKANLEKFSQGKRFRVGRTSTFYGKHLSYLEVTHAKLDKTGKQELKELLNANKIKSFHSNAGQLHRIYRLSYDSPADAKKVYDAGAVVFRPSSVKSNIRRPKRLSLIIPNYVYGPPAKQDDSSKLNSQSSAGKEAPQTSASEAHQNNPVKKNKKRKMNDDNVTKVKKAKKSKNKEKDDKSLE